MGMDAGKIKINDEAIITLSSFVLEVGQFNPSGELTIFRGPNGCGKSTLLRALAGTLPLSQGRRIASSDLRIGFVPQNYRDSLLPWLSARSNLALLGNDPAPMVEALTQMGMSENDLRKRPYQLSGGQCQRLALVRECYFRPHLLLLDEPFAALDIHTLAKAGELVRDAIACGSRAVIATHDPLPESLKDVGSTEVPIIRVSDDVAKVGGAA